MPPTVKELGFSSVLDKGYVRLVDMMGDDVSIVRAARVSYASDWRAGINESNDVKLIHYLWKNKHTTPFEAVTCTFEIKAPIFVFRQWHRHRTQSYNEVSARYTELPNEFYVPSIDVIGAQSKDNKQARDIEGDKVIFDDDRKQSIVDYMLACQEAFIQYDYLLKKGWPRELARMVLPLSTYSRMFTTMNLRNLFHFIELRDHPHAQFEIRQYAIHMLHLINMYVPIATEAFNGGRKGI